MRTLQRCAEEALQIQDACNGAAIAHSLYLLFLDLADHINGTDERNKHPLVRLYLNKLLDLAGGDATIADWNYAYDNRAVYTDRGGAV